MPEDYILQTGEADKLRLNVLGKLYYPFTYQFLQDSGLKPGMTVLDFGCGTGMMSVWLTNQVGPAGKVIALDSSQAQIDIAKQAALDAGISNIEFVCCDVSELAARNITYDFVYGRWVLLFTQDPEANLKLLFKQLNPGGVLTYETVDLLNTAYYSYPYCPELKTWIDLAPKLFKPAGIKIDFGSKIYGILQDDPDMKNLYFTTQQPPLRTPEEKSVYRLGFVGIKEKVVAAGILSASEAHKFEADLAGMEQREGVVGFYRNMLFRVNK
jgi:SAM-dependent methyltransferase